MRSTSPLLRAAVGAAIAVALVVCDSARVASRPARADWIDDLAGSPTPPKREEKPSPPAPERRGEESGRPEEPPQPEVLEVVPRTPKPPVEPMRPRLLKARTWNLSAFDRDLDAQSQGIIVASDGNVYFAASTRAPRRGAVIFRYRPDEEKVERLCGDLTAVCGEDPSNDVPQGIVSTVPVEMDGWVYWGTHSALAASPNYRGGHIVGYHQATGTWRDLGVLRPGHTIYAGLAGDPRRRCLFATVSPPPDRENEPTRIFRVDVATGAAHDLGVLAYGGMIGYPSLWVDRDGNCWASAPGGDLVRYNAARGVLEGWLDQLPYVRILEGFTEVDPSLQATRRWWWTGDLGRRNMCLFTLYRGTTLYLFLPRRVGEGPGAAFRIVTRDIGMPGLACAALDGHFFFLYEDRSGRAEEAYRLRLRSVDYTRANRHAVDHGQVVDDEMRLPREIGALAVDSKRRVYLVGTWTSLKEDVRSLTYDGAGGYIELPTALFFAVLTAPEE